MSQAPSEDVKKGCILVCFFVVFFLHFFGYHLTAIVNIWMFSYRSLARVPIVCLKRSKWAILHIMIRNPDGALSLQVQFSARVCSGAQVHNRCLRTTPITRFHSLISFHFSLTVHSDSLQGSTATELLTAIHYSFYQLNRFLWYNQAPKKELVTCQSVQLRRVEPPKFDKCSFPTMSKYLRILPKSWKLDWHKFSPVMLP